MYQAPTLTAGKDRSLLPAWRLSSGSQNVSWQQISLSNRLSRRGERGLASWRSLLAIGDVPVHERAEWMRRLSVCDGKLLDGLTDKFQDPPLWCNRSL